MKKKNKIIKFIILLIMISIVGYIVGFLYNNYRLLRNKSDIGIQNIEISKLRFEGFKLENDYLVSNSNNPKIFINYDYFKYIKKLKFDYDTNENYNWSIKENYANVYGLEDSGQIEGQNNKYISIFAENISKNVNQLEIDFELKDNIKINNIRVDNSIIYFALNYYYFIFGAITIFLCVYFRKQLMEHVEYLFLILALFFGGTLLINNQIACGKSWDDQIHFDYTYGLANEYFTKAAYEVSDIDLEFTKNNFSHFNTDEEKEAFSNQLNEVNSETTILKTNVTFDYSKAPYLLASIPFFIGNIIKLPFNVMYTSSLFINLFLYIAIVFFAIKKIPVGKYLMLTVSLIPTTLFLASSFSYDPPITASIFLGIAYLLSELKNKDKKLSISSALIITASFTLGTIAKPIYSFLLLTLLLLPKDKFKNEKVRRKFYILVGMILILTLFLIIVPVLNNADISDARGGNTNAKVQVLTILKSPISFIKVFWDNAVRSFMPKIFSAATLLMFGYFGSMPDNNIYYIFALLLLASIFIKNENYLNVKNKVLLFIFIALIIAGIWGSLYVSFTPVGSVTINGVQNRYFIPLILPLLLLLSSNNVKVRLNDKAIYNMYSALLFVVMALTLFIKFI